MKDNEPNGCADLHYRVGRRGSSLTKISKGERYVLMQRILRDIGQVVEQQVRLKRAQDLKAAGKSRVPGTAEHVDKVIANLQNVETFDPIAHIEQKIRSRLAIIERNHAEIEVLLKVRELIEALEHPPAAGERSSAKREV